MAALLVLSRGVEEIDGERLVGDRIQGQNVNMLAGFFEYCKRVKLLTILRVRCELENLEV